MKNQGSRESTPDATEADTQGHMIREPRVKSPIPPYDHNGGLFPYQFLHPTISDGYILSDGSRLPYP